jgi:hypothetical protein
MFSKYLEEYKIGETWMSKGRTITEADLVMFFGIQRRLVSSSHRQGVCSQDAV